MIEDRRKHPRYSVLTRCVLNWSGGRRELLCTEVGPASAFLHTRPDGFEVGGAASLEMRAGGLGSPMTKLTCRIARVVPGGGPGPSGLAVVWQTAACDLGLDALVRFLTTVLRLPQVSAAEVTLGGHAEFDIAGYHAGVGRVTVGSGRGGEPDVVGLAARAHSSGRHSALNATVAGLAATTSTGPRPTVPNPLQDDIRSQRSSVSGTHPAVGPTSRTGVSGTYPSVAPTSRSSGNIPSITAARPTPTPSELPEWRRPSSQGPAPRLDQPVLTTGRVSQQAIKMVLAVASEALDGPPPQLSQPTPGLQPPAVPVQGIEPLRRSSQSRMRMEEIPVAAVRPATGSHVQLVLPPVDKGRPPVGERTPGLGWKPPTFSPKSSSDPFGFAEMTATPPAAPPVATLPSAEEGTQQSWPVYALGAGERRSPTDAVGVAKSPPPQSPAPALALQTAAPRPSQRRHDRSLLVRVDHPVAYERCERVFRGRAVSIGPQAVAVVTHEEQPQLDEWVVVHLPLGTREQPFTIYLCGKLLQITTETELGPRFVMHIERVEEGRYPGSFQRFLETLGS